jgi:hypothetical protein
MYCGRVCGLIWTVLLVKFLGIDDYGLYAMGFALSSIVAGPIDNPFLIRSMRVDIQAYLAERTTRAIISAVLFIVGCGLMMSNYIVGFALMIAGGEIGLNCVKGRYLRNGRPSTVMAIDTVRQLLGIALSASYLVLAASCTPHRMAPPLLSQHCSLRDIARRFQVERPRSLNFQEARPLAPDTRRALFL